LLPLLTLLLATAGTGLCAANAQSRIPETNSVATTPATAEIEEYLGVAKLRIYGTAPSGVTGDVDFETELALMKGRQIIERVFKRLPAELRKMVMEPYREDERTHEPRSEVEILRDCRQIFRQGKTALVVVAYSHPNPEVAVRISGFFAEEIQALSEERRMKLLDPLLEYNRMQMEDITRRLDEKQTRKDALIAGNSSSAAVTNSTTNNFVKKDAAIINRLVFQDSFFNAEINSFVQSRTELQKKEKEFHELERLQETVQTLKEKEGSHNLLNLVAIANAPRVAALRSELTDQKIALEVLEAQFVKGHPGIAKEKKKLATINNGLNQAINNEVENISGNYLTAKKDVERLRNELDEKRTTLEKHLNARNELNRLEKEIAHLEGIRNAVKQSYFFGKDRDLWMRLPAVDIYQKAFLLSGKPSEGKNRLSQLRNNQE
jgi:hypothetical protein